MGILFEFSNGSAIIRYMAAKEGLSEDQIRREMQQAIDETWTITDPKFIQLQKAYLHMAVANGSWCGVQRQ